MTCNRYQYQLSLHLDGRLSSARRDALTQHLADCNSCESLWRELRSAQDLALSLPAHTVSSGFRDTLLARIHAGEGTPEAVFNESVPKLVKLRYLASGAAAAAVIILGMSWYNTPELGEVNNLKFLAKLDPVRNANIDVGSLGYRPFTPTLVAETLASSISDSVADLQFQTADLASRVERMSPRQLLNDDVKLAGLIKKLHGSVGPLRWMQDGNIITLPTRFDSELRLTEIILGQLQSAESPAEFRFALGAIDRLQIEHLRDDFQVICCQKPEEFYGRFSSAMSRYPDIGRTMQVQTFESGGWKMLFGSDGSKQTILMRVKFQRGNIGETLEKRFERK